MGNAFISLRRKALALSACIAVACGAAAEEDRWVYMSCSFWGRGTEVDSLGLFTNVAARAKAAGYNGMLLASHFDVSYKWVAHLTSQVTKAKAFCDAIGMDVIPMLWDVGYGGDCPGNWVESRGVEDLPYVRRGGKAVFDPAPVPVRGGSVSNIVCAGGSKVNSPMRVTRNFRLKAGRRYVVHVRARSTGVPTSDKFQFIGFIPSRKNKSAYYTVSKDYVSDGQWHDVAFPIEARTDEEIMLHLGHWGKVGRLEIEKIEVHERGICGATRRKGIPFVVKDAESGRAYVEGRDYAEVPPIALRNEGAPLGPYLELEIPPQSRIREGARLLVSAEIPSLFRSNKRDQYSACMSNPDYYARMDLAAQTVQKMLRPKKWFLCLDELRCANTCAACRARNMDMAHLIGYCLKRQREAVRRVSPDAVCYVWGDMLDPNHNAKEGYANTRGSFEGIAKCIPQDLVIAPWIATKAEVQASYWAANGFRCIAGAYYDDKTHENARLWRAAMDSHPGMFTGWMYATWRNDFSELERFAEEMTRKR